MNIITVEKRTEVTKAKQLRRQGIVPCIIYGGGLPESLMVQINHKVAKSLLGYKREGSKLEIKVEDQVIPVQIKDITCNTMNHTIEHISFQALEANKRVNSKAQIIVENTDKVVGMLEQMVYEVPYSALPADMVDTVVIDLDGVAPGKIFVLEDLAAFRNEAIDVQMSLDTMILRVNDKKRNVLQAAE